MENVKAELEDAIEIAEATKIETKLESGEQVPATAQDVQEMMKEHLYSIADLLGMSELYLND